MAAVSDVGEQVQLFFDLDRIQMIQDVTQVVHEPTRHPRNPLIRGDRAWEKVLYFVLSSGNVLYSPREDLFRVWYEDLGFEHAAFMADPNPYPWDHMMLHYLYATSKDGLTWDKPALDQVPSAGPGTNVVWGTPDYKVHVLSVVDDPRAQGTDRRFKSIYVHPTVSRGPGHEIAVGWSPDGIRWTPAPILPDFGPAGSHLGDVLIMSYDQTIDRFVLLTRHPRMSGEPGPTALPRTRSLIRPRFPNDPARENRRRIYRSESEDLLSWTEPELVFAPDDEDEWEDTFFGMVQFRRGPLMIGLLSVFHTVENSWNVQLAFSRDNGHSWRRVGKRRPFLGYGPDGAWDRWCVSTWSQPIVRGEEIWMYYGGAINHHDYWWSADHAEIDLEEAGNLAKVDHGMGLATIRLDGFVSASAFYRQGIIVTHPLSSTSAATLELNARTRPGGFVSVELTDADDQVIEGFSREACDQFAGDAVVHTVTWQGRSELPKEARDAGLGGVKVRFYLKQADVFSHRFAPADFR
jgi:hypothetical protein